MNKYEITKDYLHLTKEDFQYGVAIVPAALLTAVYLMEEIGLHVGDNMPSANQFIEFMATGRKMGRNAIYLILKVMDPEREDFRIQIEGVTIDSEYAKLNTQEDVFFWAAFMNLGKKGEAEMEESEEDISWLW